MIDFRYHLVSLIAVFLALAIGIVLGAGPLRGTIGDTLTGQVQDLRADREQLRAELEATQADVNERSTYLEDSAQVLLAGALTDQRVAVVTLPGTDREDVEAVRERLTQAGAQVVGQVAVTDAWTDPENQSFRQTFAGQLAGYLDPAPADDASTDAVMGLALGAALTGADGDALSEDATTLMDLLTSAEAPLVTVEEEVAGPADATVLVGPRAVQPPAEEPDAEETRTATDALAAHVALAEGLTASGRGSVTVGAAAGDMDLVDAVRSDEQARDAVTTVDSIGEVTAAISTPLALAVSLSGSMNAYGFQNGAEQAVPPRVEIPVEEPAATETAPAAEQPTAEPTDA
jgi:outer membrane murein-binding lipoprotein Lpp